MTIQELAQQILDIAQTALETDGRTRVYISDNPGIDARSGLEAIIKLCQEVQPVSQEAFRQYEKKMAREKKEQ